MNQTITSTRSLLLATAGHVDHGKSTFVRLITGTDPDRLPIEKLRGMTTDLGFAFSTGLAFIDCPGHESYLQHALAGLSAVDGVCLIVDGVQGPQEQTYEHLFAIAGLKIPQVFLVITHGDKIAQNQHQEVLASIQSEVAQVLGSSISLKSMIWSPNADQIWCRKLITDFFKPSLPFGVGPLRYFIDRSFTLPGVGGVFTGTHIQGKIKRHDHVHLWLSPESPVKKIQIKSIKIEGESYLEAPTRPTRLALSHDYSNSDDINRGALILSPDILFYNTAIGRIRLRSKDIDGKKLIAQIRTLQSSVQVFILQDEIVRLKFPNPIPIAKDDQIFLRFPDRKKGLGHLAATVELTEVYTKVRKRLVPFSEKKIQHSQESTNILDSKIETLLNSSIRWDLVLSGDDLFSARSLSKQNRAYEIKDGQFISVKQFEVLKSWITEHFSKNSELEISDVKGQFSITRQHAVRLLEFCDRQYWTFRKGMSRRAFKLPSSFRPSAHQPIHEHAHETHSDKHDHLC